MGGYGQCGTCVVDVIEGAENLSPRNAVENRLLKSDLPAVVWPVKTIVNGPISVITKPDKKESLKKAKAEAAAIAAAKTAGETSSDDTEAGSPASSVAE